MAIQPHWQWLWVAALAMPAQEAGAQQPEHSAVTIHRLLRVIAGNVLESAARVEGRRGPAILRVMPESSAPPVENALLDEANAHGSSLSLVHRASGQDVLEVWVLGMTVAYQDSAGTLTRSVDISLEARLVLTEAGRTDYLGTWSAADRSIVHEREEWSAGGSAIPWDQVAAPLVVLVGTALIVFLFFTVRS